MQCRCRRTPRQPHQHTRSRRRHTPSSRHTRTRRQRFLRRPARPRPLQPRGRRRLLQGLRPALQQLLSPRNRQPARRPGLPPAHHTRRCAQCQSEVSGFAFEHWHCRAWKGAAPRSSCLPDPVATCTVLDLMLPRTPAGGVASVPGGAAVAAVAGLQRYRAARGITGTRFDAMGLRPALKSFLADSLQLHLKSSRSRCGASFKPSTCTTIAGCTTRRSMIPASRRCQQAGAGTASALQRDTWCLYAMQALAVPQAMPPPQVQGDVGEWFRRLTAADSGILYEDTYLQVQHARPGSSGCCSLCLRVGCRLCVPANLAVLQKCVRSSWACRRCTWTADAFLLHHALAIFHSCIHIVRGMCRRAWCQWCSCCTARSVRAYAVLYLVCVSRRCAVPVQVGVKQVFQSLSGQIWSCFSIHGGLAAHTTSRGQ